METVNLSAFVFSCWACERSAARTKILSSAAS